VGGIFVNAVWQYAARSHRLLSTHVTADEARQIGRRYLIGPLAYAGATVIGLVLPWQALLLYVFLTAFFLWPGGADRVALAGTGEPAASTDRREDDG
jgi:hypothetical protein